MIHPPSNSPSLFKRVIRRLGLDSKQAPYFFYVPNAKSEKGSLVALAAVFMLVVAVLIPVAMTLVRNVRTDTSQAQLYVAGAQNAAKAGLEDALGYFIRQGKLLTAYSGNVMTNTTPTPTVFAAGMSYVDQPFNPVYNTANAQYSDTFQGTTVNLAGGITHAFYGLCNEYPIDASANSLVAAGQTTSVYFARYEIAEQTSPALISPTATLNPLAVHDITGTRQPDYMNGDGLVWAITSTGYIYKRVDYSVDSYGEYNVPYNVYPNKVLATAKAYTEFRKLSCTLPSSASVTGDAAVYVSTASNVNISSYSYLGGVVANGYGMCAMSGSVTKPTGATSNNFFGGGVTMNSTNAPISDVTVFGMSLKDIQFIADYVGSASPAKPLSILTANKLSYYNGNLTYAATQTTQVFQQLNSSGILIVNGNLYLGQGGLNSANSVVGPSYYSGIVFCTGNMTIDSGCQVDGVVIMGYSNAYSGSGGNLTLLGGAGGNFATLTADPVGVNYELTQVAQYREDISARRTLLAFPGI